MQARHEGALRAECTLHPYREKQQWSERKSYQKLPGTAALFKGFPCGQLSELKPHHLRSQLCRSPEVGQRPLIRLRMISVDANASFQDQILRAAI
jgi:hypothetical protein